MIWPKEVTLVTRTQPSGPLCLWQCFSSASIDIWQKTWVIWENGSVWSNFLDRFSAWPQKLSRRGGLGNLTRTHHASWFSLEYHQIQLCNFHIALEEKNCFCNSLFVLGQCQVYLKKNLNCWILVLVSFGFILREATTRSDLKGYIFQKKHSYPSV